MYHPRITISHVSGLWSFHFFFLTKKKKDSRVTVSSNRNSKTSNSHTHTPGPIDFWDLPNIVITVLMRTQTWDVGKPQQPPTSWTTPTGSVFPPSNSTYVNFFVDMLIIVYENVKNISQHFYWSIRYILSLAFWVINL